MASSGRDLKRRLSADGTISPPPVRRKVQSLTTQTAVASFFTPISQKPPERTVWTEHAPDETARCTLLVGKYMPTNLESHHDPSRNGQRMRKVAAFDFDSTLIQTMSGKKHASEALDWKWWHSTVPGMLRKLCIDDGYLIAIISNQAGLALKGDTKAPKAHQMRVTAFKGKVNSVFNQLDVPLSIYAATEKDVYRKPRTGMWKKLLEDHDLENPGSIDLQSSFFVGDAGGRVAGMGLPKDFSSSDRDFADNVGIKFFTPEEYFLQEPPRSFRRMFNPTIYALAVENDQEEAQAFLKRNDQDVVVFCGSPGIGKSTYFWTHLQPLRYERINQDIIKTRERCIKVADEFLSEGKSVAIDNTNADKETRSKWVALAAKYKVPIRCVLFLAEPALCEHNNAVRALNHAMNPEKRALLPSLAFSGFASRYQRPELSEGFQDIVEVRFKFRGTKAEREIWSQYWT